jgi:hypothetical protein
VTDIVPGDVVALKSGGRDMVVIARSESGEEGPRVEVMWQAELESRPMSRIVPVVALVKRNPIDRGDV